jgi:uncharacterized protein YkwD
MDLDIVHRQLLGAAALCIAAAAAGCTMVKNPVEPGPGDIDSSIIASASAVCVDEVNRLRAAAGDPPLTRSATIDAFSAEAARVDGTAHEAHRHFLATNGGYGTSMAENVIPWWKLSQYGSVETIVRKGVAMMWAEGDSGYHYVNMRGRYTQMGCGIAVINGEVTVSQDFR